MQTTRTGWLLPLLLALALLAGCGTPRVAPPLDPGLFDDAAFKPPAEAIDAASLFTLSPQMQGYLKSPDFTRQLHSKGVARGLVDALYQKGDLKLEYDASITRNAAQTFATRSGNCLSLVIMTAAFARELGLSVQYRNVLVGENWSRSGDVYLSSTHVNLSIGRPLGMLEREMLTIDFQPPAEAAGYRSIPLEEDMIIAMYMNNRAAEALVANRLDDAYWWARGAVVQQSEFAAAFNTLGVIYQRRGNQPLAERVFRAALERNPDNLVIMRNLVPLLDTLGKHAESQALEQQVAELDPHRPYHLFQLGMAAMEAGQYALAKSHFRREVNHDPRNHEFRFWLANACERLGQMDEARAQMAQALEASTTPESRALYAARLAQLRGR